MDQDEFREQMTRCRECGSLMDGGCCEPPPLAYMVEREFDRESEGGLEACMVREFYCLNCAVEEAPDYAVPVDNPDLLRNPYVKESCYICGEDLI